MREQNGRSQEREALVKGLKEKLDWYTMCASDEEYDEKAVESILYLLDSLEPLEKVEEPEPEEAWGRFQALVKEREVRNSLEIVGGTETKAPKKPETVGEEVSEKPEPMEMADVLWKLGSAEVMEVPEKPEPMEMADVLWKLGSVKVMEVSEKPEQMEVLGKLGSAEAAEVLEKPEQMEAAEVLGKLGAVEVAEVLGKLESVKVAEVLERLEVPGISEMTRRLDKLEPSEAAGVSEQLEGVDIPGEMTRPELEDASELVTKLNALETGETTKVSVRLEGVDISEDMAEPELEDVSVTAGKVGRTGKSKSKRRLKVVGILENGKDTEISEEVGISTKLTRGQVSIQKGSASKSQVLRSLSENQKGAVLYNKYIVAAVLLLLVVSMVGIIGNVQAGASPDTGFFHWLKRDNTGIQMITSPENLNSETDVQGVHTYSNRDDVPEWAQEWLKVDDGFEFPESYEWLRYEIEECRNFHKVASVYKAEAVKGEVLLGMVMYYGDISLNTESFPSYNYIGSYELSQQQMNVYNKQQESGKEYFIISFYENTCQYFMQGQDLEELKGLIEQYWLQVKNNLEKNEIICNKMLSQVIYK